MFRYDEDVAEKDQYTCSSCRLLLNSFIHSRTTELLSTHMRHQRYIGIITRTLELIQQLSEKA